MYTFRQGDLTEQQFLMELGFTEQRAGYISKKIKRSPFRDNHISTLDFAHIFIRALFKYDLLLTDQISNLPQQSENFNVGYTVDGCGNEVKAHREKSSAKTSIKQTIWMKNLVDSSLAIQDSKDKQKTVKKKISPTGIMGRIAHLQVPLLRLELMKKRALKKGIFRMVKASTCLTTLSEQNNGPLIEELWEDFPLFCVTKFQKIVSKTALSYQKIDLKTWRSGKISSATAEVERNKSVK